MSELQMCLMCGKQHKVIYGDNWETIYCCSSRSFNMSNRLFDIVDDLTKERWLNAIYNYVYLYPYKIRDGENCYWKFFYEENDKSPEDDCKVNLFHLMKQYPYQVIDRIDKSLLNISKMCPALSDTFSINDFSYEKSRLLYCESKNRRGELISIFSILKEQNYIEVVTNKQDDNSIYRLTFNGWQHIAKLNQEKNIEKQGFIAMSFAKEVEYTRDF